MEADRRREAILQRLHEQHAPVSASALASELGVSRQIIVGDIAILRARGEAIVATARGYTRTPIAAAGQYIGKVACRHSLEDTEAELLAIVGLGGTVLDVIVEHSLYGELTGQLAIASPQDAARFAERVRTGSARLLSELTGGVHLHTISCRDAEMFSAIRRALADRGLLYGE